MAHQVFISYATEDEHITVKVCEALEKAGIPCWYAPRDIPAGRPFESAIVDAIRPCKVLILVFSGHANVSKFVELEIQNAHEDGLNITVIPFRLENIKYNETLQFYLHSRQWLDASTQPLERHFEPLLKRVRDVLGLPQPPPPRPPPLGVILKALATTSLGAVLLVFLAAWVGFFNLFNLDDWAERRFISYMDGRVEKKFSDGALRLLLTDEARQGEVPSGDPEKIHRRYHAELLDALAAARARVVAFDVDFEGDTQWDEQFAQSIRQAQERGTRVVVGVGGVENGRPKVELPQKLRDPLAGSWGNTEAGLRAGADGPVLQMQLAQKGADDGGAETPVAPSFALQVVGQAQEQPAAPFFNPGGGVINLRRGGAGGQAVKSIPVDDDLTMTIDIADENALKNISRSYQNVYDNRAGDLAEFRDKIVLVGYRRGDQHYVSDSVRRYGAEIQANAISNMLQDVYIRHLSPAYNFLVILLMGALGALVQTRLGRWVQYKVVIDPKIITLLVICALYFVAAVTLYKHYRLVLDMAYHVTALFLLYWAAGAAVERARLLASQKEVAACIAHA